MKNKTVWIIHQEGSTPETGMGGRHYYLGEELAKMGVQVYVIVASYCHTMRSPPLVEDNYTIEKQGEGFYFVWVKVPKYIDAHSKKRVLNWFLFTHRIQGLKKYLRDNPPDTILCTSPPLIPFLGAKRLAKYFNAKLVFEVRDIWPLTLIELGGFSERHPFIRLMSWIEKKAYQDAQVVISNLKYSVEHMTKLGMPRHKFHWIPNGFSKLEVLDKEPLSEGIASRMPKSKFVIGYTGTFGFANCLEHLIEAANGLKSVADIEFVLVGDGKLKQNLKEKACSLNLGNVHFIEAIPKTQIQSMLAYFDVCYIGLKKDDLFKYGVSPNKLFDYFYSGKPIIYGIDSGKYSPVEEAQAGIEIKPEDHKAIQQAILDLYEISEKERIIMGERGKKLAIEKYEYSELAKQLEQIIF